jgi:hypothetical protein
LACHSGEEGMAMRIEDKDGLAQSNVYLFLTQEEAAQLRAYLDQHLREKDHDHFHLSSEDYQTEVTVTITAE